MIELDQIGKTYNPGKPNAYTALRSVDLRIEEGEFIAITGKSGAGKSTLLHILGCIDSPTEGRYSLFGEDVGHFGDRKLSELRNRSFGFVMQDYALISHLSAYDNIRLPALLKKKGLINIDARIREIAERVGVASLLSRKVNLLSGGEQQRVAIARALIHVPKILIADEPTGNLDSQTSEKIMNLFREINRDGVTVIAVTHDRELAGQFSREIVVSDGRVLSA